MWIVGPVQFWRSWYIYIFFLEMPLDYFITQCEAWEQIMWSQPQPQTPLPHHNSLIMFFLPRFCCKPKKILPKSLKQKKKIVSSHGFIRRTQFDQRSPRPPEDGVLNCHRHTHTQTDMATLWLIWPWRANSVNIQNIIINTPEN